MSPRPRATSDVALLAAGHRAVLRLGPNLTLADVAREAGVSPATLVQRFGSKRGLLLALTAGGVAGLAAEFARIRSSHRSPLAAVYGVADCMAAMAGTPEMLSNNLAFLQIDLTDPEFHQHALAHSCAMHAQIKALLDEAVAGRELRRADTGRLARAVQTMIGGSLLGWAVDRDGKAVDRLREDLDTLLGPRVRPARGPRAAWTRRRLRRTRRKIARE
jgi:AcrR family transcriptional regulator